MDFPSAELYEKSVRQVIKRGSARRTRRSMGTLKEAVMRFLKGNRIRKAASLHICTRRKIVMRRTLIKIM